MNIKTLKSVLPSLLQFDIVPFIWGNQGIGKTESVKQVAADLDIGFVHLHLATQEVGDLVGLLKHRSDGTVEHSRPEWFPTEGAGIIFLDELNRAHPDVIQSMFSFITSKTIHRHQLPKSWKIVAAGNYASDDFQVTDTSDAAWMSRFCHIELQPTADEFVSYAKSKQANSVAEFIMNHKEMLEVAKRASHSINVTPDRRSWLGMIAPLETVGMEPEVRMELYSGIIGATAAASFMNFKTDSERRVDIKQILENYERVRSRMIAASEGTDTRFDVLAAPFDDLEQLINYDPEAINEQNYGNLVAFMQDIPLELLLKSIKRLSKLRFKMKQKLLNDESLAKRFIK